MGKIQPEVIPLAELLVEVFVLVVVVDFQEGVH